MKRSSIVNQFGTDEAYLQIQRDLRGIQELGRMQFELLKSVQDRFAKLVPTAASAGKAKKRSS